MKRSIGFLPVTAAALLALSGCAALQGQDLSNNPVSDEGIASIANSRLDSDPMTASATLSVSIDSGLAILYGTVPNEATRQRAIQILQGTEGIFEVLDNTRRR
jgi:osmotically-inducible protein OsmY